MSTCVVVVEARIFAAECECEVFLIAVIDSLMIHEAVLVSAASSAANAAVEIAVVTMDHLGPRAQVVPQAVPQAFRWSKTDCGPEISLQRFIWYFNIFFILSEANHHRPYSNWVKFFIEKEVYKSPILMREDVSTKPGLTGAKDSSLFVFF